MKIVVASHAYITPVNHDKLRALASYGDVELTLLAPATWRTAFGRAALPPAAGSYRVVASRVILGGHIGGFIFRDGIRELRGARPDLIHAELEPWSLAALQLRLVFPAVPLLLFTWENLSGPPRTLQRVLERLVLRRVAGVIAGNQAARARMLGLGVAPDRVFLLPQFGVDLDRYARGDPGRVKAPFGVVPPRPRPVVGYVGRLVPEKGIDLLIDAMDPALGARLLVVGAGPARASLERRVATHPAPLEAHFAGAVHDAEIPHYLAAMDVLVLPSRTTPTWAEQFGHVLIEAMAAGVAVVGSSSGAIPEVVGDAGLIFAENDAVGLREQLRRVLQDRDQRARLIDRGRRRVQARYTHAIVAAAQHDIYGRLLRA